ncbi:hypothetical protein ACFRKB_35625 [Streptomyces scopuliridis]|uniref:hypothetical protein n=1 Tax=Streptomyces scopuliridis TaxID=452529 RepID=UPI0036B48E94
MVKRHSRRGCDDLALLARRILLGKDQLHDVVGRAAGGLFGLLGRPRIERVFAQELARRIPLPVDAQLSTAARGLQIAGIYVCVVGKQSLTDCACLHDVLIVDGQERLQQLLQRCFGGLAVASPATEWERRKVSTMLSGPLLQGGVSRMPTSDS